MPKLTKSTSGLIFYDDFSVNNLIWNLSPSNYDNVSFGNGLRIHHNDTYTTLSILEPGKTYSFVCKLNHIPVNKDDIGGVIVMSNNVNYAECQSYISDGPSTYSNANLMEKVIIDYVDNAMSTKFTEYAVDDGTGAGTDPVTPPAGTDPVPGNFTDVFYPYIKFAKLGDLYSFYASSDGITWIEIGNTEIPDSNRVGFFLYAADAEGIESGNFTVEYAALYSNNYIVFDNIKPDQHIEIRTTDRLICTDQSGFVVRKDNKIIIDTTNVLMPLNNARFIVLQDNKIVYEYSIPSLIGGDSYSYGYNLKICVANQELSPENLFYLGEFIHNDHTVKLDIYNNEDYELRDLKVTITSYSVYYGGEETMSVSLYDENQDLYKFEKSVIIPSIKPTEGKSILLKLTDKVMQDFYKVAGSYRFKINIE
jgi:hypothetical protein